jgi:hypothetical protein
MRPNKNLQRTCVQPVEDVSGIATLTTQPAINCSEKNLYIYSNLNILSGEKIFRLKWTAARKIGVPGTAKTA